MQRLVVLVFIAIVVMAAAPADACLHAHARFSGPTTLALGQQGQQGLLVFRDERQELVLAVDYKTDTALDVLAWIVPVPTTPDAYETASPKLFDELATWVKLRRVVPKPRARSPLKGRNGGGDTGAGERALPMRLLEPAQAGPYAIQPIVAVGPAGVAALQAWLKKNEIAPMDAAQLTYYIERGWTFLAIRIDPKEGSKALAGQGGLPPLRISFKTDRAVYPLKLSSHQGVFPVRLYIVTDHKLGDAAFSDALARGFEVAAAPATKFLRFSGSAPGTLTANVATFDVDEAPEQLKALLTAAGLRGQLHLRTLHAPKFGAGVGEPDDWPEDLAIPSLPEGKKLMYPKLDEPAPKVGATPSQPAALPPAVPSVASPPTTTQPTTSDGCSCNLPGAPQQSPTWLWLLAAFALGGSRRASSRGCRRGKVLRRAPVEGACLPEDRHS